MKLIGKAEIGDMIFDLCPAFSKHRIIIDERMSQQAGPAVLPWQMPCNSSSNEAKMYLNLLSLSVDSISYSEWILTLPLQCPVRHRLLSVPMPALYG